VHLTGVVCLAGTQRRIQDAAAASASEAGLPAATLQTLRSRTLQALARGGIDARFASVAVSRNGRTVDELTRFEQADDVVLTVSIPASACLPKAIGRLAPWLADEEIVGEARLAVD
jgi:hypothetical protein